MTGPLSHSWCQSLYHKTHRSLAHPTPPTCQDTRYTTVITQHVTGATIDSIDHTRLLTPPAVSGAGAGVRVGAPRKWVTWLPPQTPDLSAPLPTRYSVTGERASLTGECRSTQPPPGTPDTVRLSRELGMSPPPYPERAGGMWEGVQHYKHCRADRWHTNNTWSLIHSQKPLVFEYMVLSPTFTQCVCTCARTCISVHTGHTFITAGKDDDRIKDKNLTYKQSWRTAIFSSSLLLDIVTNSCNTTTTKTTPCRQHPLPPCTVKCLELSPLNTLSTMTVDVTPATTQSSAIGDPANTLRLSVRSKAWNLL